MSEPIRRSRPVPYQGPDPFGEAWTTFTSTGPLKHGYNSTLANIAGTQITVSEGNPVSLLGKSDADIGSDFYTTRVRILNAGKYVRVQTGANPAYYYNGLAGAVEPRTVAFPPDLASSKLSLQGKGSTAVARVSPVDSQSEALTAIAEAMREGLPSLPGASTWQERARISKGAGSDYLNYQFGWAPLLSEIGNVTSAAKKASEIIRQLERDNGRMVRRTYEFPDEESTEVVSDVEGFNQGSVWTPHPHATALYTGSNVSGRLVRERKIKRKTWFSGAFVYHVPTGTDNMSAFWRGLQKYDALYGIAPTPDVIWNLAPWSWAVDWFANIGDVLSNVSNRLLYGQVLRYGYVMETTTVTDTYTRFSPNFKGGTAFHTQIERITKQRVKASPFGFGIDWDGFDAYQLSILAALGITRGKR